MKTLGFLSRKIDIFGPKITLTLNNQSKVTSKLGIFFSLTLFCVFCYVFYSESEEVLFKNNPQVTHYDVKPSSIILPHSELENIPFYIIGSDLENYNHLNYYDIKYNILLTTSNFSRISIEGYFDPCDKSKIKSSWFVSSSYMYCINNHNNTKMQNLTFINQSVHITILKCQRQDGSCIRNQTYYDIGYYEVFEIGSTKVNLFNYANPFIQTTKEIHVTQNSLNFYTFSRYNVLTKGDMFFPVQNNVFGINDESIELKDSVKISNLMSRDPDHIASIVLEDSKKINIYKREYKTFTTALAQALSVVKIVKIMFFLINIHTEFMKNTYLINKLFDYSHSMENTYQDEEFKEKKVHPYSINKIDSSSNINSGLIQIEDSNVKQIPTVRIFKLGYMNSIKSTFRCKCGPNKDLLFYNKTKNIVTKYTNLEYIIELLLQLEKMKMSFFNDKQLFMFNSMNKIIVDNNKYPYFTKLLDKIDPDSTKAQNKDNNIQEIVNVRPITKIDEDLINALDIKLKERINIE